MSFGLTQQVLWYRCWGLINSPLVAVSVACVHVLVGSTTGRIDAGSNVGGSGFSLWRSKNLAKIAKISQGL